MAEAAEQLAQRLRAAVSLVPRDAYTAAHAALGLLFLVTRCVLMPVALQMLAYAAGILYIGAHQSLPILHKAEPLSRKDAVLLPAAGSAVLLCAFLAYRLFGKPLVDLLLTGVLVLIGSAALAESLRPALAPLLPEEARRQEFRWNLRVPFLHKAEDKPLELSFGKDRMVAYGVAGVAAAAYCYTKSWTIHNLLAVGFSLQAVALVSYGRFAVGLALLCGCFLYDAVWALSGQAGASTSSQLAGPIQVICPASWEPWRVAGLGLGDIVIPGIFVAMCLRFDAHNHKSASEEVLNALSDFPKPYFWRAYGAYLVALLIAGITMSAFGRQQPPLLLLAPGTTLTLLGCSYARDEFSKMLAYNEEELMPSKAE